MRCDIKGQVKRPVHYSDLITKCYVNINTTSLFIISINKTVVEEVNFRAWPRSASNP